MNLTTIQLTEYTQLVPKFLILPSVLPPLPFQPIFGPKSFFPTGQLAAAI